MNNTGMQLIGLGQQLMPPDEALSRAVLTWSAEDRWGESFWWWLEVSNNTDSDLKLEIWNGGFQEDRAIFYKELHQSAVVASWSSARSTLLEWSDNQLSLPLPILDHAMRTILANLVSDKSKRESLW